MNNGLIAIMDTEEAYAVKLAGYFKEKSGLGYNVQVFTDINSFLAFDQTNYTDILIISEACGDYAANLINTGQVYILSEGSIDISLTEYSSIYKYQSAENIIREVMTNYASTGSTGNRVSIPTVSTDVISVYSPIGRCGKTTFALVLGCLLAKKNNTLYISLEEYSGMTLYTGTWPTGDLSDLLYFYRQNPCNLDKKLLSLSHSLHGLDYIPPIHFSLDLKYMDGEDWHNFIRDMIAAGRYQNIILDISDSTVDIFELINMSDIIYFPVLDDAVSLEKINNFKYIASKLGRDGFFSRLREIRLPSPNISTADTNAFDSLLFGTYGSAIAGLIKAYDK